MTKHGISSDTINVGNEQCSYSIPDGKTISSPHKQNVRSRCSNLVQNHSFETGLTGWETHNVTVVDSNPFEGTQVASLGPGVSSMFQDVSLAGLDNSPLFLSFEAIQGNETTLSIGNLVAEILWLDAARNEIATGLRLFIPAGTIDNEINKTFFDITDLPPTGAVLARLQFSKSSGTDKPDIIKLDQIILTPTDTINLVQNSGFQLGLTGWVPDNAEPNFFNNYEGTAHALLFNNATLSQDVPIACLPINSSFLLSFAVTGVKADLNVQVLWLDDSDQPFGTPGLSLNIDVDSLEGQNEYLTYLDVTQPAPHEAVKARIVFASSDVPPPLTPNINIDKVIMVKCKTRNLVQNSSFNNGLTNWTAVNTVVFTSSKAYEGNEIARIPGNDGGVLFQDIPILSAAGHCFLLDFGYRSNGPNPGELLAEVVWLDRNDNEIGLGLSLIIPSNSANSDAWLVYTGITEPAPSGAVMTRLQFSKSFGNSATDIDKVVLVRLV